MITYFYSNSGGVGLSTICYYHGLNISSTENKTLIISLKVSSTLWSMFNQHTSYYSSKVMPLEEIFFTKSDFKSMIKDMTFVHSNSKIDLMRVTQYDYMYKKNFNTFKAVEIIRDLFNILKKKYSNILVELPTTLNETNLLWQKHADQIHLVTTPEAFHAANCTRLFFNEFILSNKITKVHINKYIDRLDIHNKIFCEIENSFNILAPGVKVSTIPFYETLSQGIFYL